MAELIKDATIPTAVVEPRRLKRPDRKKFQSEVDRLSNAIKTKETHLKSALVKNAPDSCQSQLRQFRQEKEEAIDRRRKIGERLMTVNKEITNKRDGLSRVHSTLKYKSEDWINEAIKRLEYQLRVHNFKLKEEKTIVKEIDSLNRSRRNLREYVARKAELDAMAKEQESMRNERDSLFKKVAALKIDEEKVIKELAEVRSSTDKLKQELDQLYSQKRHLVSEFRRDTVEYNQQRTEQHRMLKKKSEDTHDLKDNPVEEKYRGETQLCDTLLTYLGRFESKVFLSPSTPASSCTSSLDTCDSSSEVTTPVSPSAGKDELDGFLLRKKEEGEWYCVSSKGSQGKRNVRRDKKKQLQQQKKKCITHTPETFRHFERLGLNPPAFVAEVPAAMEQLKAKKKYLQHLVASSSEPSSSEKDQEFPLYTFAQNVSPSPQRDEGSADAVDEEERPDLSRDAEPTSREEVEEPLPDHKPKRTNFRLSLQICDPSASGEELVNGSCDSASPTRSLQNRFDAVCKQPDVLIFRTKDILSLPGPSQQVDVEVL